MDSLYPIITNILNNRGVKSESEIREFLSLKPKLTYDPYLLYNMKEGVDLILQTIKSREKICIYGDYDADGVTATSLLLEFLGYLTDNVTYHIPSRFNEGYGLNCDAIDSIKADGTSLIITVDCGSVSNHEVEHAKNIGLKILVTDHHNLNEKAANCLIINPKQKECQYPFKDLSGCGVAFKVAQGLQRAVGLPKELLNNLLDLVAIATIGDIVPLLGENRTLVKYGLALCKKGKRPGLDALITNVGLNSADLNSDNIAYVIVPHLNAAGRMENANVGVKLLIGKNEREINESVKILSKNNRDRKNIQEETLEKCLSIVENRHAEDLCLLIDAEDAHEGITGIVAGKIKDIYRKPTIVLTKMASQNNANRDDLLKGTGRSIEAVNLYDLLNAHAELFEKFGGHSGACGLSMKAENLEALKKTLNTDMLKKLKENPKLFLHDIKIDGNLEVEDVGLDFVEALWELAPFGHANEKPKFKFSNVELKNINFLGSSGQHVRFSMYGASNPVNCILFNKAAEYYELFKENKMMDLIGTPEINLYKGYKNIQIKIEDVCEVETK